MPKIQRKWTKEEIEFVKQNIKKISIKEIANHLNRTVNSIHKFCSVYGIFQRNPPPKIGDKINRWTIKDIYLKHDGKRNNTIAFCRCDCGTEKEVILKSITKKKGGSKSCGCLAIEIARELAKNGGTHKLTKHPLYRTWDGIKSRCFYECSSSYKNYGGKGIDICDEWLKDFMNFYNWAIANGWQEGLSIDRKDNDLGYSPENCRWATRKEQNNNRSTNRMVTAFGETKTAMQWLEDPRCVVKYFTSLTSRLNLGWEPERAITQPAGRYIKRNR